MAKITLKLVNQSGAVQKEQSDAQETQLALRHGYALGDYFEVEVDHAPTFLMVSMDESLGESLIYVTEKTWKYVVPFNLQREWPYPAAAFAGSFHYVKARFADESEVTRYRNVLLNMHDQRNDNFGAFPHASANAETRGEYVFFARNAIDGIIANEKHGNYPYQSWGINQDDNAELTVELGRPVAVDAIGITLRADYPHDSYWTEMTVEFSDGSTEILKPQKISETQKFTFSERKTSWIKLKNLVKEIGRAHV